MSKTVLELEKKNGLEKANVSDLQVISTGSLMLNAATNLGGVPVGKIIEVQGPESSGKSTATLHQIAEFQKAIPNKQCALFDYENSFDKEYAENLGVDVDKLLIYQPDNQEQGLNMLHDLMVNDLISLAVIDSHTAAPPQKVVEGEIGDSTIGLQARNHSTFLSKIKGLCGKHNCTIYAVSQTRANIGGYGPSDNTTGGNSWKFYADMRFRFTKSVDKDKELNETTITVIKNKCAQPFGVAKFNIVWGEGFDYLGELIDILIEKKVINKGGAWLTYGDLKIQGKEKFKELLKDNQELKTELEVHLNA